MSFLLGVKRKSRDVDGTCNKQTIAASSRAGEPAPTAEAASG
jgi:hypothetical protein